jgi:protein gp37
MAENSKIQWTDATFNIVWGCSKVSDGCKNCYADTLSHRYGFDVWGKDKERRTFGGKHWNEPLKWNREAEKAGVIKRVFCSSMCDVFEDHPIVEQERQKLWPLIESTPHLDWLLLTKRPENMRAFAPWEWWPDNVVAMTSVENDTVLERVGHLLTVPASRLGLSCEPLLGPVELKTVGCNAIGVNIHRYPIWITGGGGSVPVTLTPRIHWVIVGGESGAGARPMNIEWAMELRRQCASANVPFFMKQLGGTRDKRGKLEDFPPELRVREFPIRPTKRSA